MRVPGIVLASVLSGCSFSPAPGGGGDGGGGGGTDGGGGATIDAPDVLAGDPDAPSGAAADASVDAMDVTPPKDCPGFAPLPGGQADHLYQAISAHTWPVAVATCVGLGGYLAVPDDRAEVRALVAAVTPVNASYLWVGIRRDLAGQVSGSWITVEDEVPPYLPWYGGGHGVDPQPDQGDCVALDDRRQPLDGESWLFTGSCGLNALVSVCECASGE